MTPSDLFQTASSAGGWLAFAFAAGAAGFERYNAQKVLSKSIAEKEVVSDAKAWKERAELMEKMATDYHNLLEKEYMAHQATREYWHAKSSEFQVDLSKCNDKCAELQSKTDISKVERLLLEQGTHLLTCANGIRQLLSTSSHA